ncbi:MAG: MarR family winged helix-turn-helix transcriptional regulator [Thaumarchaeota archaeon]|nr:MarR family winged helix-turn-helix transcriptional regulator [Candidatus Terraquivivens yellowstonensis]
MEEEDIIWLLRHKNRRRIILAIGEAGKIGATALRDKLGISTGSLYYNLRQLGGLVQQDNKRNYTLTPEGQRVYKALMERMEPEELLSKEPPSKVVSVLSNIFFPISLFTPLYENMAMRIFLPLLSISVISALMIYAKFVPFILHVLERPRFTILDFGVNFLVSVIIVYIYTTIMSWFVAGGVKTFRVTSGKGSLSRIKDWFKSNYAEHIKFLLCLLLSLLPLAIVPGIITIDRLFKFNLMPPPGTSNYFVVRDVLLLISQGITIILMTAGISYAKNIKWQSAAMVSFSLLYFSFFVNKVMGFV